MKKALKQALKAQFEPPASPGKQEFLRRLPQPPVRCWEFALTQAGYIRKWVWGLSGLVFAAAFIGGKCLEKNMVWYISAFMPLLAMAVVTETGRSEVCGMAEFELSTRFSLRSIVLARLCILGSANGILIGLLVPLAFPSSGVSLFLTGAAIVCPYLLTAFLCLWATRKVRGKDGVFLCAGIAAGVILGYTLLYKNYWIIASRNLLWWIGALAILAAATLNQSFRMVKQTEELAWN